MEDTTRQVLVKHEVRANFYSLRRESICQMYVLQVKLFAKRMTKIVIVSYTQLSIINR